MESIFRVTYTLTNGETGQGTIVGPKNKTEADCLRLIRFTAATYGIDPDSVTVCSIPERMSKGFLHPIQNELSDGRLATVTGWYY